jgi:polyhydroxyalkanoate synthase
MPAKMHSFYLRNMYLANALKEPGGVTLDGVPIDLSKISLPTYFVSAIEDHIAPWKATYTGPKLFGGKSRFVLSGSGHIAGMINPPVANKYGYWSNDKLADTPDQWLEGAKQHEGSWWPNWLAWLQPHLGTRVPARTIGKQNGKKGLRVIEPAPGSYARQRADAAGRG